MKRSEELREAAEKATQTLVGKEVRSDTGALISVLLVIASELAALRELLEERLPVRLSTADKMRLGVRDE